MEVSNLLDKEFNEIHVKILMLTELGRTEDHNENFNK